MPTAHPSTALALALAAALSLGAAQGCSDHDHDHAASETPRTAILKEQQAAADSIVSLTRLYVEGREKSPSAPVAAPHADIGPRDAALDALFEAAKADHACDLADRIADGAALDPGREARLRSSSDLVRRVVAVIVRQASALAASGQGQATLKVDLDHLRASLRALKVELYAIQAQVDGE